MSAKINLTPDQIKLLKENGSIIYYEENADWYYLPFWFRNSGTEWNIVSFDNLPDSVKSRIKEMRGV